MAERKVLNKYYPSDFDPAKIPRWRKPKNQQMNVRMMLPMSIRCSTCGNYIYKGTKFNSRQENAIRETYLGVEIVRFYFKCTKCLAEITIKTDPQNLDYVVESGATRNFEPWRAKDEIGEEEQRKREAEEMGDAMKSLENRTLESKREMDNLSALDEIKSIKSRHARVSVDSMLEASQRSVFQQEERLEEEDEALSKSIFQRSRDFVRRIDDGELEDDHISKKRKVDEQVFDSPTDYLLKATSADRLNKKQDSKGSRTSSVRIFLKSSPNEDSKANNMNGLQSLCQQYDSNEED